MSTFIIHFMYLFIIALFGSTVSVVGGMLIVIFTFMRIIPFFKYYLYKGLRFLLRIPPPIISKKAAIEIAKNNIRSNRITEDEENEYFIIRLFIPDGPFQVVEGLKIWRIGLYGRPPIWIEIDNQTGEIIPRKQILNRRRNFQSHGE